MPEHSGTYWANSHYWGAFCSDAMRGIVGIQAQVPARTVLYRFIDLNRGWVEGAADGPWWFEQQQIRALQGFAAEAGETLAESARRLICVHDEFEKVDAMVWARVVTKPLLVWKGPARRVETEDGEASSALVEDADEPGPRRPDLSARGIVGMFVPGLGAPYRRFSALMRIEGASRLQQAGAKAWR